MLLLFHLPLKYTNSVWDAIPRSIQKGILKNMVLKPD
jgi:hypothetical protein